MAPLIDPRNKILRHPAALARMRAGKPVWPLNIEVDLSNRCQLNCSWCAFKYTHTGELIDPAALYPALEELVTGGLQAVTLSGGGEPATHPALAETVRRIRSLGAVVGVYTNAVWGDSISAILDELAWLYVSLDATSDKAYRQIKGRDYYSQVICNIKAWTEQAGRAVPIGLGFLLDSHNWREVPEAIELSRSLGATYCQFRPVVKAGADYGWVRDALNLLARFPFPDIYYSPERFLSVMSGEREYTACRGSSLVPCIGADGTVWVCPNTRGLRPLGNIYRETFRGIWKRRLAQEVGPDCRVACRNDALNRTLDYVCGNGPHDGFV